MRSTHRRYFIELTGAIVAYAIVLVISITLLNLFPDSPLRVLLALAPMIPACFIPFVVVRMLGRVDELQRRIQLEALGFAFAGTAVLTFAYGFLQVVGFPPVSWFAIWPIMALLWVIGAAWASRRYR